MYACRVREGAARGPASKAACVMSWSSERVSSGDLSRMVRFGVRDVVDAREECNW